MTDDWKKRFRSPKDKKRPSGAPLWYSRGYLPHFDIPGLTQTVTFRLFDSLPQSMLELWSEEVRHLPKDDANRERRNRVDAYLDRSCGSCYLKDDRLATIVQDALVYYDRERYLLHAWVIMPNHVHTLFTSLGRWELSRIVHTWKSYTASECNRVLGRKGDFWQREPFDRFIRNEEHYANALRYIESNPVKAGLCTKPEDWVWGSAYMKTHASTSERTDIGAQASLPAGSTGAQASLPAGSTNES